LQIEIESTSRPARDVTSGASMRADGYQAIASGGNLFGCGVAHREHGRGKLSGCGWGAQRGVARPPPLLLQPWRLLQASSATF